MKRKENKIKIKKKIVENRSRKKLKIKLNFFLQH
jgi:hypothetical protein